MANRLAQETSPYLLQHKDNPVDWHPWDEIALNLARESEKPILLSIGYASCHWCHVMAQESFEDAATASVMNDRFVNVKVDREERPDLDKVYQLAHHLLTKGQGGWPLTLFLDPETLVPFFGGTYFPKAPRYQLPGFVDLLLRVSDVFDGKRDELAVQGEKVLAVLKNLGAPAEASTLNAEALLAAARKALGEQFDHAEGGFGTGAKFPMPQTLERLLRHWAYQARASGERDREALDMVMTTLTRLARGGVYDHLGGGFCRYATDRQWRVPHFEKMLYDNALLIDVFADALAVGPDALFEAAVRDSIGWLLRELRHPDGAFYAALDADSEGEEGQYYVWRRDQVKRLLTAEEYDLTATLYGLDKPANFEGRWTLHRRDSWRSVVARLGLTPDEAEGLLTSARSKLLSARAERERPALDDKLLTGWNGLAIHALVKAGLQLKEAAWLEAAEACAAFLYRSAWHAPRRSTRDANEGESQDEAGLLFATWKDGQPRYAGYLDDYANVLRGVLTLLEARWRDDDFRWAEALAATAIERFLDREAGGFFFTAKDQDEVLFRPKPTGDDAQPPGNATLARALFKLGHLSGNGHLLEHAARILRWAQPVMEKQPANHCSMLSALEDEQYPPELIIIRGPREACEPWLAAARNGYVPWRSCYHIPYDATRTPAYLPRMVPMEERDRVTAYVCQGSSCSLPIRSLDELRAALA